MNAFCPHWQLIGFEMGANAETDLYLSGLFRYCCKKNELVRAWTCQGYTENVISVPYQRQGTVTAHAETGDSDTGGVEVGKLGKERFREFVPDVRVHAVSALPRGLSSIDIEAGASAKVPVIVFTGDTVTA